MNATTLLFEERTAMEIFFFDTHYFEMEDDYYNLWRQEKKRRKGLEVKLQKLEIRLEMDISSDKLMLQDLGREVEELRKWKDKNIATIHERNVDMAKKRERLVVYMR